MAYTSWSGMAPPLRESTLGLDKDRVGDSNIRVVSELTLWRPQTPYLDCLLSGGALVYLDKFFVKRKISTPDF